MQGPDESFGQSVRLHRSCCLLLSGAPFCEGVVRGGRDTEPVLVCEARGRGRPCVLAASGPRRGPCSA